MTANPEGFKVQRLRHVNDVLAFWGFFVEGLTALNRITRKDKNIETDVFLRVIMDTVSGDESEGAVWVFTSKNDKPLFFCIVFNNTSKYHKTKSLLTYAVYSNEKSATILRFSLAYTKDWARKNGYKELQAFSPRFSGAGYYLFEKVLGFKRFLVHFTQEL